MRAIHLLAVLLFVAPGFAGRQALVLQTDFGLKDGAVAAMKGVAFGVDSTLPIFDLSHENTPYDIWQASYRLKQTASYWPAGTVFVSVVDPGVGTERKSVVLETRSGHYFVGPDNGTWTHVAEDLGVKAVRQIDERVNRLSGSEKSYTFHGRDVYVYTGARLAAGKILFSDVGPELPRDVVALPFTRASLHEGVLLGSVDQLDFQFGNVWTNIPDALWVKLGVRVGDRVRVKVMQKEREIFAGVLPYVATFGGVAEGEPLVYLNSLLRVSIALNQGSFARTYGVEAGAEWKVEIRKGD